MRDSHPVFRRFPLEMTLAVGGVGGGAPPQGLRVCLMRLWALPGALVALVVAVLIMPMLAAVYAIVARDTDGHQVLFTGTAALLQRYLVMSNGGRPAAQLTQRMSAEEHQSGTSPDRIVSTSIGTWPIVWRRRMRQLTVTRLSPGHIGFTYPPCRPPAPRTRSPGPA